MSKELAIPSHLKKLSFDNILTDIDEDEENENVTKNGSLLNISQASVKRSTSGLS